MKASPRASRSRKHSARTTLRLRMLVVMLAIATTHYSFAFGISTSISSSNPTSPTTTTTTSLNGGGTDDNSDTCKEEQQQLVIVTGGSRGIGRATCLLLASRGYHVAVNYRSDAKAAESLLQEIKDSNNSKGKAMAFQADVSVEEQVTKLFDDVTEAFGMTPTGLVNNAGIMEAMEKDIVNVDRSTLEADFATNAYGPFFCTKEFVRRTSTNRDGKGGAIVCVSSVSAESGQPLAYAMSKAAQEAMLAGLTKTLPLEGIRINTIVPGLTDTDMAPQGQLEKIAPYIPMRRAADPNEVAEGIAYLLSDASSYCCGAKIRIAGGL